MRKRIKWIILGLAVVIGGVGGYAYWKGHLIPNYPPDTEFPVRGIDVSHHQGAIRWDEIPKNIQFVYIKATEGSTYADPNFKDNWDGSREAGIRHGAYHFFRLATTGDAQAHNFLSVVPHEKDALPPVIDLELGGNDKQMPEVGDFQREFSVFRNRLKNALGTEPVVYTEPAFANRYFKGMTLPRLWIQNYLTRPRPGAYWDFWQFTERMPLAGIEGLVDGDVYIGSKEAFSSYR